MKSDASRLTFDPRKHFSSVRLQQGRVQIDADSNEQIDIVNYRANTEASDVIGLCGAPMHDAGFQIQAAPQPRVKPAAGATEDLAERVAGSGQLDFMIGAGRYYVDGILCENEQVVSYLNQNTVAELPNPDPLNTGFYVVYLDVWERLLTAIDDPSIREVALGGPDTAARVKTVWQVKCWQAVDESGNLLEDVNCLTKLPPFDDVIAPSSGELMARTVREKPNTDACIVSPGAGYTGLENQLYRVEIHQGGPALDINGAQIISATRVPDTKNQLVVKGTWKPGQALEIVSTKPGDNPMNGTLAHIITAVSTPAPLSSRPKAASRATKKRKEESQTLTLDIDVSALAEVSVRTADTDFATFKWSRDNGVVVTTIESINGPKVIVHDLGPDDTLGFKPGQWVELSDDTLDLNGRPGQLAQITRIDSAINEITLNVSPTLEISSDPSKLNRHPKLRRWEGVGAVKYDSNTPDGSFIGLENGVQVGFSPGQLRTGDYWMIPARTATADTQSGNIEWPQDKTKNPLSQLPFGIKHHYCRIGIVRCTDSVELVQDCRNIFPPLTELMSLFYVGGDGQEAMPGNPQPQPLQVRVFNGQWPVPNARMRFSASDGGQLTDPVSKSPQSTPTTFTAITNSEGVAGCIWTLNPGSPLARIPSQYVEARLLDAKGDPLPPLVRFNGNLSIAEQVSYYPGSCGTLQEQGTVQQALSRLSELRSLYKISGDGQEIMPPDEPVAPLKVLVASPCGPVTDDTRVKFSIVDSPKRPERETELPGTGLPERRTGFVQADGGEKGASSIGVHGEDGFWSCNWIPDPAIPFQEVEASIQTGDRRRPTTPPETVRFSLTLSTAAHVRYIPGECKTLIGSDTVQKAIEQLSHLNSIYEVSGNHQVIMSGDQTQPLKVLVASPCGTSENAEVTFEVEPNNGTLDGGSSIFVARRQDDGFWTCNWKPDSKKTLQAVQASIKGAAITPPTTVHFSLSLISADHVAYTPGECATLSASNTVQKAIEQLSLLPSLYEVSGNHQEVIPGETIDLVVLASNSCGPLAKKRRLVAFTTAAGSGTVNGGAQAIVDTDANGFARCAWERDPEGPPDQEVVAKLLADTAAPPTEVHFVSTLSRAAHVSYDPSKCQGMASANVTTVQGAIDHLCQVHPGGGGCDVTVGAGGQFERLQDAINDAAQKKTDVCICLMPGDHLLENGLTINAQGLRVKIVGCGRGSRLNFTQDPEGKPFKAALLTSLTLRDLEMFGANFSLQLAACQDITIAGCYLIQENQKDPLVRIAGAKRIRFEGNVISATKPMNQNANSPVKILFPAPTLFNLFRLDSIQFGQQASRAAADFAGSPAVQATAQQIGRNVSSARNLTTGESRSYNALLGTLGAPTVDVALLQNNLAAIRVAALGAIPGLAIVLDDGDAETRIEDNDITGVVSLYGLPGTAKLTADDLKKLSGAIKQGTLTFTDPIASLHIRNNVMYRIDASGGTIDVLKSLSPSVSTKLEHAYRRCFVTNNVVSGSDSVLVMDHLALMGNSFDLDRSDTGSAGSVIAGTAVYASNHAPNDIRMVNVARVSDKSANLIINIVDGGTL